MASEETVTPTTFLGLFLHLRDERNHHESEWQEPAHELWAMKVEKPPLAQADPESQRLQSEVAIARAYLARVLGKPLE